ncbi:MAG: class I SAM-dependent methyltransferase [Pseudomonadota bacterium]
MADITPISLLLDASKKESFEHFKPQMEQAMLFRQKERGRVFAITRAIKNGVKDGLFVEFGVAEGGGCRTFGKILGRNGLTMTGFDSFEGLQEDWTGIQTGRAAGAFSTGGALPKVPDNVTLVKGWVQDTLPGYLKEHKGRAFGFIHMDMDTYTPTAYAMKAVKKHLRKGTVILFDELYGYPGWRHHEYKALTETLDDKDYTYISFAPESVAIEMLRTPK